MVMVEVRGVKFPAYIDQLDFPYFKRFTEKKLFTPKKEKKYIDDVRKEKQKPVRIVDGVWLSFLPKFETDEFGDDVVVLLKVHLVNHTEEAYNFIYAQQFLGRTEFDHKNVVQPFEDFYLHDIRFADMSDSPAFSFEFSLVNPQKQKAEYFEAFIKPKPKQVFERIEKLKEKGEATFSYKLFDVYPDKQEEEKPEYFTPGLKPYDIKDARRHLAPSRSVVDLHIEKLSDNWKGLSNTAILDIQLREFEKWYDLAIAHRIPHMIVIHGIGKGRLRDDIHDILRRKKEVRSFVNQFHPSFGWGATEIYFQYK
jgi:hypothetical protein